VEVNSRRRGFLEKDTKEESKFFPPSLSPLCFLELSGEELTQFFETTYLLPRITSFSRPADLLSHLILLGVAEECCFLEAVTNMKKEMSGSKY